MFSNHFFDIWQPSSYSMYGPQYGDSRMNKFSMIVMKYKTEEYILTQLFTLYVISHIDLLKLFRYVSNFERVNFYYLC